MDCTAKSFQIKPPVMFHKIAQEIRPTASKIFAIGSRRDRGYDRNSIAIKAPALNPSNRVGVNT